MNILHGMEITYEIKYLGDIAPLIWRVEIVAKLIHINILYFISVFSICLLKKERRTDIHNYKNSMKASSRKF